MTLNNSPVQVQVIVAQHALSQQHLSFSHLHAYPSHPWLAQEQDPAAVLPLHSSPQPQEGPHSQLTIATMRKDTYTSQQWTFEELTITTPLHCTTSGLGTIAFILVAFAGGPVAATDTWITPILSFTFIHALAIVSAVAIHAGTLASSRIGHCPSKNIFLFRFFCSICTLWEVGLFYTWMEVHATSVTHCPCNHFSSRCNACRVLWPPYLSVYYPNLLHTSLGILVSCSSVVMTSL